MVNVTLEKELHQQLGHLAFGQQRKVLDFARSLASAHSSGVPGNRLMQFAGSIAPDDLDIISQTIHAGCEKVDADEW